MVRLMIVIQTHGPSLLEGVFKNKMAYLNFFIDKTMEAP